MQSNRERFGGFQLVIMILCLYVLVQLIFETVVPLSEEWRELFLIIDTLICVVFLLDFALNVKRAKSPVNYIFRQWGWVDFVSSIPMVGPLRAGRALRLVRLLRLLRAVRSTKYIIGKIFANKANSTLFIVSTTSVVLITFASIAILDAEQSSEANIRSVRDAIWWSFVTISTVGYGDKYPVTLPGQLLGVALIIAGVGLFGTFTAYVSSLFVKEDIEKKSHKKRVLTYRQSSGLRKKRQNKKG